MTQRLLSEIPLNHDDFTALLLSLLFAGETFSIDQFALRIPPSNYLWVFTILIFELRKNGVFRVNTTFQSYFPTSGPSFHPKTNFYSVYVLGKHLNFRLEELITQFRPKKTAPTAEFLVFRDRNHLMDMSRDLRTLCDRFRNRTISFSEFHAAILSQLHERSAGLETIRGVCQQHQLSLQIRNDCMALCGEINGSAIAVAADFIQAARIEPDTKAILKDLEAGIRSGVKPVEGCFLAEAWGLIHSKAYGFSDGNTQLELFERALLGFEDDFHEKTTEYRPMFNACVAFPRLRDFYLSKKDCQTGTALIVTDTALSYTLYLMVASLVESMVVVERLDFLKRQGLYGRDLEKEREAVNQGSLQFFEIRNRIQAVVKQLKGLPFVTADLSKFVLQEGTPPWQFPPELGMDGLSPADMETMRAQKLSAYGMIQFAAIRTKSRIYCTVCKKALAVRICDRCLQFVTCDRCQHVCPLN